MYAAARDIAPGFEAQKAGGCIKQMLLLYKHKRRPAISMQKAINQRYMKPFAVVTRIIHCRPEGGVN